MAKLKIKVIDEKGAGSRKWVSDPRGFFLIYLADRKIFVEHYRTRFEGPASVTGTPDFIFQGISAKNLGYTIIDAGLASRLDHAAYLGRELQKAEYCLKNGKKYVQDSES
ncbi:Uncharacterised protein [Candidatus Gugararchaeum adminiculabundum]|nr:Uncharacterised protein [Candidatus Gugararchaeum adminiculabundum]